MNKETILNNLSVKLNNMSKEDFIEHLRDIGIEIVEDENNKENS